MDSTVSLKRAGSQWVAGILCASALGCTGGVSGGDGDNPIANVSGGAGGAPIGPMSGPEGSLPSPVCETGSVVPVFHRLNRVEYQNSVNQLLGTELPLAQDLPVDALVYGFNNNADVSMSATLMQKYLSVALQAVETALASQATRAALVPCSLVEQSCSRTVLTDLLSRAYRRPASADEVEEAMSYFDVCTSGAEAGFSCALQATLLSPKFLFRTELLGTEQVQSCPESAPLTSTPDGLLSPHALATRLAYFLTDGPPDAELQAAAESGALLQPGGIAQAVDRLLGSTPGDLTSLPFADDFIGQWLQLDAVSAAAPSPTLFPEFDESLRQALGEESRLFFRDMVDSGASALDLVRSGYTFLNARLAEHYGIAGVVGENLHRVDTTGLLRGGVLTQGSFLVATSSSENTSIVQRAKFVLTNLLCEHLPAPPPGAADSVPPPDPGLGLTNRESLEIRTGNAPCNGCHAVMNPIGFGLEVFDAIGRQRATDQGKPIDASGELPGGLAFSDTEGLLQLLKQDPRFPACMTKKMLTYALGRGMQAACDTAVMQELGEAWKADGYNLRNHIVRLADSALFKSARAFVDPTQADIEQEAP